MTLKKAFESQPTDQVVINGWIQSVRKLKNVAFADLTDGTTNRSLMVVMKPEQSTALSTGSCIRVRGTLKQSPGANQDIELVVSEEANGESEPVSVLGESSPDYPLQKKFHSPEFLRSIPQFRWKASRNASVLRYRSYAQAEMAKYFAQNDFTNVNSPILTSSDCEGAGEVFSVSPPGFFGTKSANLTVSSQLHLEVFAASLSRVWNITPAFRAEQSDTSRHLSEFWMVEAEIAFTKELEDVMSIAEDMIRSAVPDISEDRLAEGSAANILAAIRDKEKQRLVQDRWKALHNDGKRWARITYTKAIEILQSAEAGLKPIEWGSDLGSEHEKYLAGEVFKGPVFITDYPTDIKPFYMKPSSEKTVACFDLLVPDLGELIGGSLREDNYDRLIARMQAQDMNVADMQWYTDLRKYGTFPHGGYGMGFERFVSYICGIENVRDSVGFPRWAGSIMC